MGCLVRTLIGFLAFVIFLALFLKAPILVILLIVLIGAYLFSRR